MYGFRIIDKVCGKVMKEVCIYKAETYNAIIFSRIPIIGRSSKSDLIVYVVILSTYKKDRLIGSPIIVGTPIIVIGPPYYNSISNGEYVFHLHQFFPYSPIYSVI
ncbi:MAG: hypothetical protein ACRD5B_10165 [Nitrososphaeraceae archaeon]